MLSPTTEGAKLLRKPSLEAAVHWPVWAGDTARGVAAIGKGIIANVGITTIATTVAKTRNNRTTRTRTPAPSPDRSGSLANRAVGALSVAAVAGALSRRRQVRVLMMLHVQQT